MKTIIIYNSKSGFTKQYAEWINEEVKGTLIEYKDASIEKLLEYDTIIYGGSVVAANIRGIKLITDNYEKLKDKKVIVFSSSMKIDEAMVNSIKEASFKNNELNTINYYPFMGGIDLKKLGFMERFIFKTVLKQENKKSNNPIDLNAVSFFGSKDEIKPLVDEVLIK